MPHIGLPEIIVIVILAALLVAPFFLKRRAPGKL
jgi:hypothetical protein